MIIKDKIFKASLLETLADKQVYLRARGTHDDAYSLATAKYYAPEIDRANTALKTLKANVAERIKPALMRDQRRRMLGWLGAKLEYYAWEYHCSLAGGNDNVLPAPTATQVDALYATDTLARHALQTITDQFIQVITDITSHVDADWDDIHGVFFPGWTLRSLTKLSFADSDPHKGGKSVVMLGFKAERGRFPHRRKRVLRLVYKPSDLTLDFFLVGDTARVRAVVPALAVPPGGSLLEIFNARIGGPGFVADPAVNMQPAPVLPVYPILPRNGGNVTTAYGYIKFLTHDPTPQVVPAQMRARRLKLPPERRDWIASTNDELLAYYRLFGWYCAIALNFGLADAHNGNMIVHRKKPYLIDNEISFKWPCDSLGKTGLHQVMQSWGPWDKDYDRLGGDKCQLYYANPATNAVEATKGSRAAATIKAGLREAFALIVADPGGALRAWLQSPELAGATARYTPRATRSYGESLREVYFRTNCGFATPNPPGTPWHPTAFMRNGAIKWWYNGLDANHRPNYAMCDPQHDWADYLNCDYPAYYRVLGSRDLLNSRGAVVAVANPPLPYNDPAVNANRTRTIAGPAYFDHFPAVLLFDVDVSTLNGATGTIGHLNGNVIADLGGEFANANPAIHLTGAAVEVTETADRQWRVVDGGRVFHILRVGDTDVVEVYEASSAIAMITSQFDRFRADPAFRDNLRNAAYVQIDAENPPNNPPNNAPAIYNGF